MSLTDLSLDYLLAPRSTQEFFADGWQKGPYVVKRERPEYFTGIFGAGDLDSLISLSQNVTRQHMRLVRTEGKNLSERPLEYAPNGSIDIYSTYRAYTDGFSIVANSMDTRWPQVAQLCRNVEKSLRQRVSANLYATPAGAQGFTPHYDTHDVIVLQLTGTKRWNIYRPLVNSPLESSNEKIEDDHLTEPYRDFLMEAGDLLYMPRGWVHQAFTSDVASIHLTLGIHLTKWMDVLLDAVLMAASEDEELRATFPLRAMNDALVSAEVAVKLHELLARVASRLPVREAIEVRARGVVTGNGLAPDGHFAVLDSLNELSLDTRLYVRPGIVCNMSHSGSEVAIHFRGNVVRVSIDNAPALRFVGATSAFSVRDLPEITDEQRLILARRLIVEGLLSMA